MEMACPGAPGSTVGQQQEFAKAKEKTQAMGKKQSSVHKLEAVEKSPVFCGKCGRGGELREPPPRSRAGPGNAWIHAPVRAPGSLAPCPRGGGERGGVNNQQ